MTLHTIFFIISSVAMGEPGTSLCLNRLMIYVKINVEQIMNIRHGFLPHF